MTKRIYLSIQVLSAVLTLFVFLASVYFQYVLGLHPCPLCMMQRICVLLLLALMGIILRVMSKAHILCLIQVLISCAGLFFSSRHLWLQSLPAGKAPACMPGLDVLLHYFPWQTIARALFWGAGDCAEVTWSMLGISMPGWSMLYFLYMAVMGLILYSATRTTKSLL